MVILAEIAVLPVSLHVTLANHAACMNTKFTSYKLKSLHSLRKVIVRIKLIIFANSRLEYPLITKYFFIIISPIVEVEPLGKQVFFRNTYCIGCERGNKGITKLFCVIKICLKN